MEKEQFKLMSKLKEYGLIIKEQKKIIQDKEVQIGILKHDQAVAQSQKQIDGLTIPVEEATSPVKREVVEQPEIINNEGGTGSAQLNELDNIDFQYETNYGKKREECYVAS